MLLCGPISEIWCRPVFLPATSFDANLHVQPVEMGWCMTRVGQYNCLSGELCPSFGFLYGGYHFGYGYIGAQLNFAYHSRVFLTEACAALAAKTAAIATIAVKTTVTASKPASARVAESWASAIVRSSSVALAMRHCWHRSASSWLGGGSHRACFDPRKLAPVARERLAFPSRRLGSAGSGGEPFLWQRYPAYALAECRPAGYCYDQRCADQAQPHSSQHAPASPIPAHGSALGGIGKAALERGGCRNVPTWRGGPCAGHSKNMRRVAHIALQAIEWIFDLIGIFGIPDDLATAWSVANDSVIH